MHDAMETAGADGEERSSTAPGSSREQSAPAWPKTTPILGAMSVNALAAACRQEISNDGREAAASVELLRRATVCGDQEARACVQQCLSEIVRNWLRCHPCRETAYLLNSEEHYVTLAFERFWQVATHTQSGVYDSLTVALQYLRASLNGALLDMLRASSRPRSVGPAEPGGLGARHTEETTTGAQVWRFLQSVLLDARELRLAYLLFHCGLSPREVVRSCPGEFEDVREISRLRRDLVEHLLRVTDQAHVLLAVDGNGEQGEGGAENQGGRGVP